MGASAWSRWSACNRTSFRAHSTSPGRCARRAFRSSSAGFHVSGCLAMLPTLQDDLQTALDMGVSLFAGEAEGRMDQILRRRRERNSCSRSTDYLDDLPALEVAADPDPARQACSQDRPASRQLRCRARMSVPMLVLHHHQRARTQVAQPLGRRRRAYDPAAPGRRHSPLLHHRRQLRAQQGLGGDLRPDHRRCASGTRSISA